MFSSQATARKTCVLRARRRHACMLGTLTSTTLWSAGGADRTPGTSQPATSAACWPVLQVDAAAAMIERLLQVSAALTMAAALRICYGPCPEACCVMFLLEMSIACL